MTKEALDIAIEALREPQKAQARWERYRDRDIVQCSNCGFGMFPIDYVFDKGDCVGINVIPGYCPNCGKKMRASGTKEVDA